MGLCCSSEIKYGSSVQYGGIDTKTSSKVLSAMSPSISQIEAEGEILQSPNLKVFAFIELQKATRGFHRNNLLGVGDFGFVYKGFVDQDSLKARSPKTGMSIAVKKMHQDGCQGQQEWLMEMRYMGQLCHPNLVRLIGYCREDDQRLLVYEFMPNGSLDKHLYGEVSRIQPLSWDLRMKAALGAAKGLAFLHNAVVRVIYRNLTTSDILLDSNFNAKISDFGMAKDCPMGSKTHVTTRIVGKVGYIAPEYRNTGHLTTKSDVYNFGVVLLELISGQPASAKGSEQELVEWAMPSLSNRHKVFRVVDVCLEGKYALNGALKVANLALQCLSEDPRARPNMEDVVKALEHITLEKC